MKKIFSAFAVMLCMSLSASAIDVDLQKGGNDPDTFPGDRSENTVVTASIDDQVLTVLFSDLTASQIVVKDSSNLTVFYQNYDSAYSAQAYLTSQVSGYYTLYIYAFDEWWIGCFCIE